MNRCRLKFSSWIKTQTSNNLETLFLTYIKHVKSKFNYQYIDGHPAEYYYKNKPKRKQGKNQEIAFLRISDSLMRSSV